MQNGSTVSNVLELMKQFNNEDYVDDENTNTADSNSLPAVSGNDVRPSSSEEQSSSSLRSPSKTSKATQVCDLLPLRITRVSNAISESLQEKAECAW